MNTYRLFSWEHSYFSGKIRAYLRYKQFGGGLGPGFEDVLATQEIIQRLLIPATQSNTVPQLLTPEGVWIQDSSEIMDHVEAAHPEPRVTPSPETSPKQCLAAYLLELLADEWMVVYGFWERWYYSLAGIEPNHELFNAQQWGGFLNPTGTGAERRETARFVFRQFMSIDDPGAATAGPYSGLVELGVTERTREAWAASNDRLLARLEVHLDAHDFVLGGLPSLGDFGLLGPLYAHLYRDAVPGFMMRTRFPLVSEWVERTNATNALNARSYNQKLYTVDESDQLVPGPATSDAGAWLPGDAIAPTLLPVLEVFFDEMWPVLTTSMQTLTRYLEGGELAQDGELPGKTFMASPGFEQLQRGDGALSHEFEIGGVRERRMVLPYQVWMLQRLADVLRACTASDTGRKSIDELLGALRGGSDLLSLDERLAGCRVQKRGGRLFAEA